MRHGGLADAAAVGEVAGADGAFGAQLAEDGQPGRVGRGLEEDDVGIGRAFHGTIISTNFDMDKYQYGWHHSGKGDRHMLNYYDPRIVRLLTCERIREARGTCIEGLTFDRSGRSSRRPSLVRRLVARLSTPTA
jgi:hypothetical protein